MVVLEGEAVSYERGTPVAFEMDAQAILPLETNVL